MRPQQIPGPRRPDEVLRAARGVLREPCPVLDELAARHGSTFALGARPMRMVIVGDPAHLADVFAAPVEHYRWGHWANVLGFVVGDGSMIVSDGEDHRRRRGAVQPGFARRRMDAWIPMIVEEADRMIDEALALAAASASSASPSSPSSPIDLYPAGRSLVLRIAVRALFGDELARRATELGDLFAPMQAYLESSFVRQAPHPLPLGRRARVRDCRRSLDAIVDAELARRRAAGPSDRGDLLDAMLSAPDGDGRPALDDAEVRDQVVSLMGAGYDTTASTLAWSLLRAATTPGIWAALRAEAERVLGDRTTAAFDGDVLRALSFTDAVVHETLRLHPAGVFSPRMTAQAVTIGPYAVPKGVLVLWSPYLSGRHPEHWPEPLRFDPSRFVDPTPDAAAHATLAWAPFGKGARRCVGFAMAQMELVLILARVAQRLDLAPVSDEVPAPTGMVVNRPAGGAPMRVRVA